MKNDWHYHGHNILTKIKSNYGGNKQAFQHFYQNRYKKFRASLISIKGADLNDVKQKVDILNDYYLSVETFERKYNVSSQSKFRSTLLEEFNGYLFQNIPEIDKLQLDFFNKGIYAGMKIDASGKISIITKDVDFCIGKKFNIKIDDIQLDLIIPIVAIEVKTYLDATMFNEVQFSMQIIKNATPNVKNYVLMERNEVKSDKIISSRADSPLDEMFVLKGNIDQPIDYNTVYEYYQEIYKALTSNLNTKIKMPGRLFNP
ncbi:MAG: Bpu10I family restriction endonuclease [Clostridia bacterium]|nr:Bpu10I family restriction endonuclease [Clostridia bacterium]